MAQAMQRTERFGQSGLLFHTPEHIRNIAPRLVVISTGKNLGAFGLRHGSQDSPCLLIHGDGFRFAFLGDRTACSTLTVWDFPWEAERIEAFMRDASACRRPRHHYKSDLP